MTEDRQGNLFGDEDWLANPDAPEAGAPEKTPFPEMQKKPRKERRRLLVVIIALLLAAGGVLYFRATGDTFPDLPPGTYTGVIENLHASPVLIFIDRRGLDSDLLVWLLKPGSEAQLAKGNSLAGKSGFSSPLHLNDGNDELVLSGSQIRDTVFSGRAFRMGQERPGSWRLSRMEQQSVSGPEGNEKLWLLLKADLEDIEKKVKEAEHKLPEQKKEIDRLQDFIVSKEGLRANADRKYIEEKAKAEALTRSLTEKQEAVEKLEKRVDLAYRVTDMGKLVSLSRESMGRDELWLRSMLGNLVEEASPELNEAYEKAQRILALQEQIASEQEHIDTLNRQVNGGTEE